MPSKQSMLGHCLLSPLSQGQEREEKMFFRRNTEILCQLFNANGTNRHRQMSDNGPIRDVHSNYNVINIPSAKNFEFTPALGHFSDVTPRPHTTSSILRSSPSLGRRSQELFGLTQPFLAYNMNDFNRLEGNVQIQLHTGPEYNNNDRVLNKSPKKTNRDKSIPLTGPDSNARRNKKKKNKTKKNDNEKEGKRLDNSDENVEGENNNDASDENENDYDVTSRGLLPSGHDRLIQSHRHPSSIQCDTLGPTACKHCIRRASLSDASIILPNMGVFSNRMATVRLPHSPSPNSYEVRTPSVQSYMSTNPPSPSLPLTQIDRHTPISVFLRTRRKKGQGETGDKKSVKFSATDTEIRPIDDQGNEYYARDEIQEVADANSGAKNDNNSNENDGTGNIENDECEEVEDVRFDEMKVSVTFKEKDHVTP